MSLPYFSRVSYIAPFLVLTFVKVKMELSKTKGGNSIENNTSREKEYINFMSNAIHLKKFK